MRPAIQAVGAALLCAAALCGTRFARAALPEVPVGGLLRDAPLRGLNGPSARLAAFRGEALLINVWASWCGPCRAETASLERLAWIRLPVRFRIIGVSTDDDPSAARAFLRSANATISQFIDANQAVERMLGASTIPLTVLVGPDGRVLDKIYGARDWSAPDALRLITRRFAPAARARGTAADERGRPSGGLRVRTTADGVSTSTARQWAR